jgi:predicted transcriptional regulator
MNLQVCERDELDRPTHLLIMVKSEAEKHLLAQLIKQLPELLELQSPYVETLQALKRHGRQLVEVNVLAEEMGVSNTCMAQRLKKLVDTGEARRVRCGLATGGHYYLYEATEV